MTTHLVAAPVAALVGGYLAHRLGIPGGLITGSLVGWGGVNVLLNQPAPQPPSWLYFGALIVIGATIGSGVTRDSLSIVGRTLLPAAMSAVLLIAAGIAIGLVLSRYGLAPQNEMFATSPGAMSVITGLVADQGTGAVEVAAFHIVRVFLVLMTLPVLLALEVRT